jgi:hypothetical protein
VLPRGGSRYTAGKQTTKKVFSSRKHTSMHIWCFVQAAHAIGSPPYKTPRVGIYLYFSSVSTAELQMMNGVKERWRGQPDFYLQQKQPLATSSNTQHPHCRTLAFSFFEVNYFYFKQQISEHKYAL